MSIVSYPCSMLFGTGVAGTNDRSLTISALVTTGYNMLAEASAAGFVNSGITAAVSFTINSGVIVTRTSAAAGAAMTTGAFENRHSITIYNNGTIGGGTGNTATSVGEDGGAGGVGFDVSCSITLHNNGIIGSGGGGGGGPGEGTQATWGWSGGDEPILICNTWGTASGASGSPGGLGAVGNNGSYYGSAYPGGGANIDCTTITAGDGGATGTSIKSNGNTVDLAVTGSILGPQT